MSADAGKLTVDETAALVVIGGRESWASPRMSAAVARLLAQGLVDVAPGGYSGEVTLRLTALGRGVLAFEVKP